MSNNNYTQSANPNATNSELDAKKIVTNSGLTSEQRDELIESFVELQVDNMSTQTMVEWITDILVNDYTKLTDSELKERVYCYDEYLFDELVDNVTMEDGDKKYYHFQEIKHDHVNNEVF